MERSLWLRATILMCYIKVRNKDYSDIYNHTLATILVEYASAVYMSDLTELFTWTCSRCKDKTEGFEIIELIVDVQNCLQAFVGIAENLNSIVIAFRGTQEHSIQNWIEDLFWKQLDLNYPDVSDAMVHHGFYSAYHNTTLRPGILTAVQRAKKIYGNIGIMVTGHSMGGAMASFCALDLAVNLGEVNVQLMTFGQPRIGNSVFVSYFKRHVPKAVRVWLYNIGFGSLVYRVEKICDGSGEDPSCSRSVPGTSIADHLMYFGVELEAATWASCGIVMNPGTVGFRADTDGNLVFSRDPAAALRQYRSAPAGSAATA
ncbi:unnamed protein product [Spirodela intermedia]|uniref:Fungal lipase-type domain-containing protein n=1 Tax=Spirodela intermedia TaxID=51605 RepID=A0A7I8I9G5_SPIIN|nr:unnamed protein product [Spirodela intermedia]CAA6654230.1 unnamed protein product [Spirodela intermedia]